MWHWTDAHIRVHVSYCLTALAVAHLMRRQTTQAGCQLTAALRNGRTPLCASCDQQRSTLGKGIVPTRLNTATEAPDVDILAWIDQAQQDLNTATHTLAGAVTRARQHSQPWSAIATVLGVSRQAAHHRFSEPHNDPAPPSTTPPRRE